MTTLLVAGATGAVGSVVVPKARAAGLRVVPHVRPKTAGRHPLGKDPEALICELGEAAALDRAMAGVDAVACLVGTMRRRFAAGDTYESSDYQPVVDLIASAKRAPGGPRYLVLLSSVGARAGSGYLGWKWRVEEAVRGSGLPHTILRPSIFDDRGSGAAPSDGRARRPPPLVGGALRLLAVVPGLRALGERLAPISIDELADAVVRAARDRGPVNAVLEGKQLRRG
jgi:uncharacterized protein YbjT (DUF2867 family)